MKNLEEIRQQIEDLAWALEASTGEFKLILARCNYLELQNQIIAKLQETCQIEISILKLKPSQRTLYNAIREEFNQEIQALMIVGWDNLPNLTQMLSSANQVREEFRNNCQYPIVLWINDEIYKQLLESATDLESWGITINFPLPIHELINLLNSIIDIIFNDDLDNFDFDLQEAALAWQDLQKNLQKNLQNSEQELPADFQANCDFLQGFIEYKNNKFALAFEYYQQSLKFWETTDNLEIQGKILYHLTICSQNQKDIKKYLQETLEIFTKIQRPDLIANSLSKFGLLLQAAEAWEELKNLSTQALQIHESENNSLKIAEDCIFLAIANIQQSNFSESAKIAHQGLDILRTIKQPESDINHYRQHLLFLLAQSQNQLQQHQTAIDNLKLSIEIGVTNNQPKLYVQILNYLQQLFLQQKQYLDAFNTKLECRSIEQQFGLRAFIGAGWLKPTKIQNLTKDNIAPEITASGRKIDVDNLLQRIGRRDYKITVIHGQSGVGKSSLVNAGLIPALQNQTTGFQDNLPVTIRAYNNWFAELQKQIFAALPARLKSEISQQNIQLNTQEDCISLFKRFEDSNLRTVLIFDQFEEFFFVYADDKSRTEFFSFLGSCLKILSLKVILSLRVDYLHLLLECNELESMKIVSQDILSKNVLYKLGNLTTKNAQITIERLTENTDFRLEPDLINQLLKDLSGEEDLASELGTVRPIELQIVGAQLQTENITTLTEYRKYGNKQELVKRYLDEVINDCGEENKEIAELLLYFLTDEQGTRPLKTRTELEQDLQSLNTETTDIKKKEQQLDLVLEIFVKSGLVVLLPENPAERYQLVHDYLAAFIRQQQEKKSQAVMEELQQERKQRKFAEEELQQAEQAKNILAAANKKAKQRIWISSGVMAISLIVGGIAGILAIQGSRLLSEAEIGSRLEREGNTAWQQFEKSEIEPLLAAMSAGQELQTLVQDGRPLEKYPAANPQLALQTILDNIHEKNQLQHTSDVYNASFSPDGKTIFTVSLDNTARLWDLSGNQLAEFKGHTSWVNNARFSPDGKTIVTASDDNTARLWDLSEKQLGEFKGHTGSVNNASFSPDGKTIVTASSDKTARLWDLSARQLAEFQGHTSNVWNASFSPDGKTIVTASDDNTARLWDLSGNQLAEFKGHTSTVYNASFSPDGKTILTASWDNTARLWDLSGKLLAEFKGHTSDVNNASFGPDGKTIVTASWDNTARLWDLSGNQLAEFKGHTSNVWNASFSPDGKTILTASWDNTARLWDLSARQLAEFKGHTGSVNNASFSPDGKTIVTASDDNTARLWRADSLDGLLSRGCKWLNDYLITRAQELEKLPVCQNESNKKLAAPFLVQEGEKEARTGSIDNAVATFQTAQKWDSSLQFDPEAKAQEFVNKGKAERLISEGLSNVRNRKVAEAITAFNEAQKLDNEVEITAGNWDTLCYLGSLNKQAAQVMFACEQAVKLAPDNTKYLYHRGLAKALTGDYSGAVEDFKPLITETKDKELKKKLEVWLQDLKNGKNPFTDEVLKELKN